MFCRIFFVEHRLLQSGGAVIVDIVSNDVLNFPDVPLTHVFVTEKDMDDNWFLVNELTKRGIFCLDTLYIGDMLTTVNNKYLLMIMVVVVEQIRMRYYRLASVSYGNH